jgi:hypothetical protein
VADFLVQLSVSLELLERSFNLRAIAHFLQTVSCILEKELLASHRTPHEGLARFVAPNIIVMVRRNMAETRRPRRKKNEREL